MARRHELEAGRPQDPAQRAGAELVEVAGRIEVEPGGAEDARLPGAGVGDGEEQHASGRQPPPAEGERPSGIRQVLEHVPGGDQVEALARKRGFVERADAQVDARDPCHPPGRRGGELAAGRRVPFRHQPLEEPAVPAAEVEDAPGAAAGDLAQEPFGAAHPASARESDDGFDQRDELGRAGAEIGLVVGRRQLLGGGRRVEP